MCESLNVRKFNYSVLRGLYTKICSYENFPLYGTVLMQNRSSLSTCANLEYNKSKALQVNKHVTESIRNIACTRSIKAIHGATLLRTTKLCAEFLQITWLENYTRAQVAERDVNKFTHVHTRHSRWRRVCHQR